MAEYIERGAVLDYIDHMPSELTHDGRMMIRRIRLTEYISDSIPAADVAPVRHGRWIELGDGDCKCSLCGCYHHAWEAHGYYCQHCGAIMDKDGDGDV